ncbi:type II toxin-antitoxin system HicA family toxin [Rippkaea orientalis]|nr:type II toxin-antitoxin system HicA family toxin [Rippkaea orientalis]
MRFQSSHHIYAKPGNIHKNFVPIHGNKDLKIGLLRHLKKI